MVPATPFDGMAAQIPRLALPPGKQAKYAGGVSSAALRAEARYCPVFCFGSRLIRNTVDLALVPQNLQVTASA